MWYVLLTGPGRILGQVQIRPEKFNVEPGRVLRLRPGRAASRLGRIFWPCRTLRILENESQ